MYRKDRSRLQQLNGINLFDDLFMKGLSLQSVDLTKDRKGITNIFFKEKYKKSY